jgi:hypothetical protein
VDEILDEAPNFDAAHKQKTKNKNERSQFEKRRDTRSSSFGKCAYPTFGAFGMRTKCLIVFKSEFFTPSEAAFRSAKSASSRIELDKYTYNNKIKTHKKGEKKKKLNLRSIPNGEKTKESGPR